MHENEEIADVIKKELEALESTSISDINTLDELIALLQKHKKLASAYDNIISKIATIYLDAK